MQFGFQEGVGCVEASFTILETISHMLERGSKIFGCFLDVRKALTLFGLMVYYANYLQNLELKENVVRNKRSLYWG